MISWSAINGRGGRWLAPLVCGAGSAAKGRYCNAPSATMARRLLPSSAATGESSVWLNRLTASGNCAPASARRAPLRSRLCLEQAAARRQQSQDSRRRLRALLTPAKLVTGERVVGDGPEI